MKIVEIKALRGSNLTAGTLIDDRFEITGLLGRGGFAAVYRAQDLDAGAPVALKVLDQNLPESHADSIRQRFEREAATLTGLSHPNIVQALAAGAHAPTAQPYIAMTLLDGQGLDALLADSGPLGPARALALLRPCLEALALAHARGIVHKDLKPSNFFITRPGQPDEQMLILDFGAVTLNALPDGRLTLNGEMIGTPQYLAPEYIRDHVVTCALDVYQIGLILVEMLTGAVAVGTRNTTLCLMSHCRGDLNVPGELQASPLGPVLRRALALDPADRYPDAAALLGGLDGLDVAALPDLSQRARGASLSPSYHGQLQAIALDDNDDDGGATAVITGADVSTVVFKALEPAPRERAGWGLAALLALLALVGGAAMILGGGPALRALERAQASAAISPERGADKAGDEAPVERPAVQGASGGRGARQGLSNKSIEVAEDHRKIKKIKAGKKSKAGKRASGVAAAGVGESRLGVLAVKSVESAAHASDAGPGNLLDGDPSTVWAGCSGEARWVSLELSSRSSVRGFVVALGYDLDLPEGGAADRVRVIGARGQAREIAIAPRPGLQRIALKRPLEAGALRLELPAGVHALGELQVWGAPSGG